MFRRGAVRSAAEPRMTITFACAIRRGAAKRPQAFRTCYGMTANGQYGTCVIGAAVEGLGHNYGQVPVEWSRISQTVNIVWPVEIELNENRTFQCGDPTCPTRPLGLTGL